MTLEVAQQPAVTAGPGEGPLDDPTLGQDDEAVGVGALDDLDLPTAGLGDHGGGLRPLIAGVGEDALDEGEAPAGLAQHLAQAISILDVCRLDDDAQQEAERVDEDVPLAPRDFLARIEALRVERGPPFEAARALWLSTIAALGLASRPSASRTAT